MSLRRKTLLAIGLTSVCLLVLLLALAQFILLRGFDHLQEESVQENVLRVRNVIANEIDSLTTFAGDWAYWDDTYQYVQDKNQEYADSNLNDDSISNLKIDVFIYTDLSNHVVFSEGFDYKTSTALVLPFDLNPQRDLLRPVLDLPNDTSTNSGIILTKEGPLLVAARNILTSQKTGPATGKLVFGRFLNETKINAFAEQTQLTIEIRSLEDENLPADYVTAKTALFAPNAPDTLYNLQSNTAQGFSLLSDITGKSAFMLKIATPDSIYQQGQQTVLYFILGLLIAGVTFSAVMIWLLEKIVLSRLGYLNTRVRDIAVGNKLSERIKMDGADELTSLTLTINTSLASMERSQAQLQDLNAQLEEKVADLNAMQTYRDRFFTNAAHEFRTPMAVLRTQLYLAEKQPALWQKHLDVLISATNQLSDILSDVFDMAQFKRQSGALYRQDVELKGLISKTVIAERPRMHQKGVQLSSDLPDYDVYVHGDQGALEQAFSKLIDFVINYADNGSAVQLSLSSGVDPNDLSTTLEISSRGLQLNGTDLSQIFMPFSKSSEGSIRNSGLQLSIAKEITELHQGEISAVEDPEKGICFRMQLPILRVGEVPVTT